MKDIKLNQTQFLEFNEFDQFGFFYDKSGFPTEDADDEFADNVKELYKAYDYIIVTAEDSIYGVKSGKRELILEWADESYSIAIEIAEDYS